MRLKERIGYQEILRAAEVEKAFASFLIDIGFIAGAPQSFSEQPESSANALRKVEYWLIGRRE